MKSDREKSLLNELIDGAAELPLESQRLLLILAQSMAYTRDCIAKENSPEPHQPTTEFTA